MRHDMRIDRSTFLRQSGGALALAFAGRSGIASLLRLPLDIDHPEPRDGITAERVLTPEVLEKFAKKTHVMDAYQAARDYPKLFDGISCACSCGGKNGSHRSLLVCFESLQPTGCGACQEEGELVGKMAKEGKTLAEIREAVDKKFD